MNKNTLMSFDDLEQFMVDVFKGLDAPKKMIQIRDELKLNWTFPFEK